MTTIIVIVVAALVFFAAISVVTLLIWKRETEMRTDSLKDLEQNVEKLLNELSDVNQFQRRVNRRNRYEDDVPGKGRQAAESEIVKPFRKNEESEGSDPFSWVKSQENSRKHRSEQQEQPQIENSEIEEIVLPEIQESEDAVLPDAALDESFREIEALIQDLKDEASEYEINLDLVEDEVARVPENCNEPIDEYIEDIVVDIEEQPVRNHMGYDIGRSGRKYTAEELEALIKE